MTFSYLDFQLNLRRSAVYDLEQFYAFNCISYFSKTN